MLQHFGSGERAVLGDMPHQKENGVGLLGILNEIGGAFAYLRHAAWRGGDVAAVHHLDGVHHQQLRLLLLRDLADLLHIGLGQQLEILLRQSQSPGPHAHLLQRLLASDIQGARRLRQRAHHLQQQCTLARPGVAPDKDGRPWHQPATKDPVKFLQ